MTMIEYRANKMTWDNCHTWEALGTFQHFVLCDIAINGFCYWELNIGAPAVWLKIRLTAICYRLDGGFVSENLLLLIYSTMSVKQSVWIQISVIILINLYSLFMFCLYPAITRKPYYMKDQVTTLWPKP